MTTRKQLLTTFCQTLSYIAFIDVVIFSYDLFRVVFADHSTRSVYFFAFVFTHKIDFV